MLNEDWKTTAERLWRSFVELRQVVEDTDIHDRIDSRSGLYQFCRHTFELRDWMLASDNDQTAKDVVTQLFGSRVENPAKRIPPKSVALGACADIANRPKHAVVTRHMKECHPSAMCPSSYAKLLMTSLDSVTISGCGSSPSTAGTTTHYSSPRTR